MMEGRKRKMVYVFDHEGGLVDSVFGASACARKYDINPRAVAACIKRGSCYGYSLYFSYDAGFKPVVRRYQHNVFVSGVYGAKDTANQHAADLHYFFSGSIDD